MRAVVQSSKGKYNAWFVMGVLSDEQLSKEEIRKGLFYVLGGDSCADTRSQVGRFPASLNPKYKPPARATLVVSNPNGFLRSDILIQKTIEKGLRANEPKDMFRFFSKVQDDKTMFGSEVEVEQATSGEEVQKRRNPDEETIRLPERLALTFEKRPDGIDYCLL